MTVQTIPAIEEMTADQQIELMEALWKSMNGRGRGDEIEPPEWHGQYLADRRRAVEDGEDEFITLDDLESEIRSEMK